MRSLVASMVFVLASAGIVASHSGATGVVKQRMDGMKEMSNATKALGAIRAGVIPFSPEVIERAADQIKTHGAAAHDLFPEGSLKHQSEALPVIWTERAKFDQILDDMIQAAERLSAAAESEAEAMAVADDVATTCKACHEKFREKSL